MPKIILNGTTYAAGLDQKTFDKIGTDTLDTDAQDLSGAVNELNSSLNNLIKTREIEHPYNITANGYLFWNPHSDSDFDMTGYTPVGIVAFTTGRHDITCSICTIADSNFAMAIHNWTNTAYNLTFKYTVLYVKNGFFI